VCVELGGLEVGAEHAPRTAAVNAASTTPLLLIIGSTVGRTEPLRNPGAQRANQAESAPFRAARALSHGPSRPAAAGRAMWKPWMKSQP